MEAKDRECVEMVDIFEVPITMLSHYERIHNGFWVKERVTRFTPTGIETEFVIPPWYKDYDTEEANRPSSVVRQYDASTWTLVIASRNGKWIGGGLSILGCTEYDLAEHRDDIAIVHDFRVSEDERRKGVGRALWASIEKWGATHGATELRVETQDVNVPACRFYRTMGCKLHSIDQAAYGIGCPETQLIWSKTLSVGSSPK